MLKSAKCVLLSRLTFGHSLGHNSLLSDPIEVIPTLGETRLIELSIHIRHEIYLQVLNYTQALVSTPYFAYSAGGLMA